MAIRTKKDRRQINVPTTADRRGEKMDRRRCGACGRLVINRVRATRGGTIQFLKCSYCGWEGKKSKQVNAAVIENLLSFDAKITTAEDAVWAEMDPLVWEAAGYKGRKKLKFKAVVVPGQKHKIRFIVE